MSGRGGVNGRQEAYLDEIARSRMRSEVIYGVPRYRSPSPRPGPDHRAPISDRESIRAHPYAALPVSDRMHPMRAPAPAPAAVWEQDYGAGGLRSSEEGGTRLYISNLHYGVSNSDIQLLFSEVGDLRSYSVHYDKSGRSKGTAEVVYVHQTDALAAIKRYNNVRLDGKPLKIEVVGTPALISGKPASLPMKMDGPGLLPLNFGKPAPVQSRLAPQPGNMVGPAFPAVNFGRNAPLHSSENIIPGRRVNFASESLQDRVDAREALVHGGGAGGGHGFAARSRKRGSIAERLTFADLDADLENYRTEALRKR